MFCRTLVLFSLLAPVLGAQARDQSDSRGSGHARQETQRVAQNAPVRASQDGDKVQQPDQPDQQDQRDRQRRRDVLREALRVQAEAVPATARQMSVQERLELRQQLRQQQEWMK